MASKKSRANRLGPVASGPETRTSEGIGKPSLRDPMNGKLRSMMSIKNGSSGNQYYCAIEKNQNGKYNIRIRVQFGHGGWALSVYFLASSFQCGNEKAGRIAAIAAEKRRTLAILGRRAQR